MTAAGILTGWLEVLDMVRKSINEVPAVENFCESFAKIPVTLTPTFEGLPGGSLVPFQNCPMFPCSRTFSVFVHLVMNLLTMFSSSNL